jgi:hypothetical protein
MPPFTPPPQTPLPPPPAFHHTHTQAVLGPIVSSRQLTHLVPPKLLDPSADPRAAVKAVLKAWLPLSEAVLGMAVTHLPSPDVAAPLRLPHLLAGGNNTALLPLAAAGAAAAAGVGVGASGGGGSSSGTNGVAQDSRGGERSSEHTQEAAAAAEAADVAADIELDVGCQLERTYSHLCASSSAADAPLVVFVSKMVAVPANLLPRRVGEVGEQVGWSRGGESALTQLFHWRFSKHSTVTKHENSVCAGGGGGSGQTLWSRGRESVGTRRDALGGVVMGTNVAAVIMVWLWM